ncbi:voltage-dependent anion channel-domain-containing protein [Lineolata rhizophorae]|uniref:Voltage-dependent anion channel-domain-containing protein n=1 Tax=Lineolata rhizophorae TaxID=578093 RepID=A0A6A6P1T3_9PEZI|nr:voltage-dependent anion channel-domain-containing protein [Lineolata rhizophorae]
MPLDLEREGGSSSASSTAAGGNDSTTWRRPVLNRTQSPTNKNWRREDSIVPLRSNSSYTTDEERRGGRKSVGTGPVEKKLGFKERIRHFTWTWFTMSMATGGIANVLYSVPYQFDGLYEIGCIFFLFNIFLFIFNIVMISIRFYLYPPMFFSSFRHPTESLFIPAAIISFGTILINITQYGVGDAGKWLRDAMVVLYWIYCALACIGSTGIYLVMWSTQTFTIDKMTPVWIFPAYPLLIVGPFAGNLSAKTSHDTAFEIIVAGFILQGIGFMVSLMVYSAFLYRLMTQKLPKEPLRPAMFISVGPSGFTITAFISLGSRLPFVVPSNFMGDGPFTAKVSMIVANWVGIWLWGLAMWWFFVSVGAHVSCAVGGKLDFAMTWYSFVFPNTALTTATFAVATALGSNRQLRVIACVMSAALVALWLFVFTMNVRAIAIKQILWPQKQEDRPEGGWKEPAIDPNPRFLPLWIHPVVTAHGQPSTPGPTRPVSPAQAHAAAQAAHHVPYHVRGPGRRYTDPAPPTFMAGLQRMWTKRSESAHPQG